MACGFCKVSIINKELWNISNNTLKKKDKMSMYSTKTLNSYNRVSKINLNLNHGCQISLLILSET